MDDRYTRLEVLREITSLNPIDYAKVMKARKSAEKMRDLYMKYEPNDRIGVDYSDADELEISLREQSLERKVEKDWKKYLGVENDGYGLREYAEDIIQDHIEQRTQGRGR